MEIIALLLAWTLGLFSSPITDRFRRYLRKKEIRSAIASEAEQFNERMIVFAFEVEVKYGQFDSKFIKWYIPLLKRYHTHLIPSELLQIHLQLENFDDASLRTHAELRRSQSIGLTRLNKIDLPFLRSKVDSFRYFSAGFARCALAILNDLGAFNENVDRERVFFKLTFDTNNDKDRQIVYDEQRRECLYAAETARRLADRIDEFLTVHCKP